MTGWPGRDQCSQALALLFGIATQRLFSAALAACVLSEDGEWADEPRLPLFQQVSIRHSSAFAGLGKWHGSSPLRKTSW